MTLSRARGMTGMGHSSSISSLQGRSTNLPTRVELPPVLTAGLERAEYYCCKRVVCGYARLLQRRAPTLLMTSVSASPRKAGTAVTRTCPT